MHHTYRNIEPLNIEWCALLSTIFNLFQGKKKLGSTPPSKHIFLIIPEFPGKKKIKIRKCVGKLHLLVTWSFTQSHYKTLTKKLACKLVLPHWICLQGLYCTNFEKHSLWWWWMYIIIDILIFRVSMNGKGYKFQLGIKFLYDVTWIGSSYSGWNVWWRVLSE
jgi:hypothetical protein